MGWFSMFSCLRAHTDEYVFVWNWLVAKHTLEQLTPAMVQKVRSRYLTIIAANNVDPSYDLSIGHFEDFDYYWVSQTLAEMGIAPMLGSKRAKWLRCENHRRARWRAGERGDVIGPQVLKDIVEGYGVSISTE